MKKLSPDIYFEQIPKIIDMDIRSELYAINEFTFAVAVILSAQATDKKVNEVTPVLFDIAPTPDKMLELGENGLKEHIRVISFFNNKAKNIIAMSEKLANISEDTNWKFPQDFHNQKSLMDLPGIGQKTANVIMNVLWGMPFIGVDTHVFRLSHRFGWAKDNDNTPEKVEKKLLKFIPKRFHGMVNHVMVLHGRYTCRAQRPKCDTCPIFNICPAPDKMK